MSGGSLDYAHYKIETIADDIRARAENPMHVALSVHLYKVAKAVHDLEWMWSGDTGPGDETKAIAAIVSPQDVLLQARVSAERALADLTQALAMTTTKDDAS